MSFISLHYQSGNVHARIKALDIAKSFANGAILDLPLDSEIAFTPKEQCMHSITPLIEHAKDCGCPIKLKLWIEP